jgi:hypothetical protein
VFNPGFAGSHLMSLVPGIVEDSLVFCEILSQCAASSKLVRLEELATRLTVDIIGRVTLDLQLNTQKENNEMVKAFRDQVYRLPGAEMFREY